MSLILTTNTRVNEIINKCVDNMIQWKYNVPDTIKFVISEPRRFLGQCCYAKNGKPLTIKINRSVINNGTDTDISQVVYHELIHASLPRGTHHGIAWQQMAYDINRITGLHISRTEDSSKFGANYAMEYKYVFKCKTCGKVIGVSRMTNFVKNYNKRDSKGELVWWHTADHGEFERIK